MVSTGGDGDCSKGSRYTKPIRGLLGQVVSSNHPRHSSSLTSVGLDFTCNRRARSSIQENICWVILVGMLSYGFHSINTSTDSGDVREG